MKSSDLKTEIANTLDTAIASGKAVQTNWLANEIIRKRKPAEGEDSDFYTFCAFAHIVDQVGRVVRARNKIDDKEQPEQSWLPGYTLIQPGYMITRGDDSIVVPTETMAPTELRAKARELRSMASGLHAHADELDRYADERERAAVA